VIATAAISSAFPRTTDDGARPKPLWRPAAFAPAVGVAEQNWFRALRAQLNKQVRGRRTCRVPNNRRTQLHLAHAFETAPRRRRREHRCAERPCVRSLALAGANRLALNRCSVDDQVARDVIERSLRVDPPRRQLGRPTGRVKNSAMFRCRWSLAGRRIAYFTSRSSSVVSLK
jgi:hypothetical protein